MAALDRRHFVGLAAASLACTAGRAPAIMPPWTKLETEPYAGKQDDVFFVDRLTGWYGNNRGNLFGTADGGTTWNRLLQRPGLGVRSLAFLDAQTGFLGNIGADYAPHVTDPTPLYRTDDGGVTWAPIQIDGPAPRGICSIDIRRTAIVNFGERATRTSIRAGGRVGGPAYLAESLDGGATWKSRDLSAVTGAILDIKFLDANIGFIAGCSDADLAKSHARVLRTGDGGRTWKTVYESARPSELIWKLSFPTARVGYATVQNYDEDPAVDQRWVAKTQDGGQTWRELPILKEKAYQEFAVGFLDERRGWIGGSTGGVETLDGGRTWRRVEMGLAVNKIRVVRDRDGTSVFALGRDLHRLDLPA